MYASREEPVPQQWSEQNHARCRGGVYIECDGFATTGHMPAALDQTIDEVHFGFCEAVKGLSNRSLAFQNYFGGIEQLA